MKTLLFNNQDLTYKWFQAKLMPTVNPDTVIGVRTPVLRKMAKEFYGSEKSTAFLNALPHGYYEENQLHAFLIEQIKDEDLCIAELNRFLPYVDNWATCDCMRPKCLKKHKEKLLLEIEKWMASDHPYTIRYGIGMLMAHFLDTDFDETYLAQVARVTCEDYYVQMMMAWYFATALAKQWEKTLPYLTEKRLPPWVHNKTIQKAVESYRMTPEQKAFLREWKVGLYTLDERT